MKVTKKQLEKLVESIVSEMKADDDLGPEWSRFDNLDDLKAMFKTLENYEIKVAPKLFYSDVYLRQFQKHLKAAKLILDAEITALQNDE